MSILAEGRTAIAGSYAKGIHHNGKDETQSPQRIRTLQCPLRDGSLTSNRKVPGEVLTDLNGEQAIEDFLIAQDQQIAEKSGKPRGPIKTIEKVKIKKVKA